MVESSPASPTADTKKTPANWLCQLAGPGHVAIVPRSKREGKSHGYRFSKPQAAALQQLAVIEKLIDMGQRVVVLPPRFGPDQHYLSEVGCAGMPLETLAVEEPLHLMAALHHNDAALAESLYLFPPEDSAGEHWQLHCSNRGNLSWSSCGNASRLHHFQEAFNTATNQRKIKCTPALTHYPHSGEAGSANTLRLQQQGHTLHVFAYQNKLGLHSNMLPRFQPCHTTLEAQRSIMRQCQLQPKTSLFVRQHWSGPDAGVPYLKDLCMSGPNTLIIHENCLADQNSILSELENILPSMKCVVFPSKNCQLKHLLSRSALGGVFVNSTILLPKSAMHPSAKPFWNNLLKTGSFKNIETIPWDYRLFGGGIQRAFVHIPYSEQQTFPAPDHLNATPVRIKAWKAWAKSLPEEILPQDIGSLRHAQICTGQKPLSEA